MKGALFLGAFSALKEHYQFEDILNNADGFVGTSIGAVFCLGFYLKVSIDMMNTLMTPFMSRFENIAPSLDISLVISNYGLDDGANCKNEISKVLVQCGLSKKITLLNLYNFTRRELVCVTTNLVSQSVEFLSWKTHPNLEVVDAVFMSMCVPFLFTPVEYNDALYIDGGLMMNFPIYYPPEETLSFELLNEPIESISNFQEYLYIIGTCAVKHQDQEKIEYAKKLLAHVEIHVPKCYTLTFMDRNINQSIIRRMKNYGYLTGLTFVYPTLMTTMTTLLHFVFSYYKDFFENCDELEKLIL